MDTNRPSGATWRDALPVAMAIVLYAALLDTAVETWWSASPVRWWVAGAVAACAVATALSWRRLSWSNRAAIPAFAFLGVAAATAWLPGGLTTGVRLVGRQTSTVLSALTAAAVVLAAAIVWRFRAIPRSARFVIVLLAAYGLAAFIHGAAAGVPFSNLFSGDSVWQRLPAALQGAFAGGLVVLPLALLVSVVRAGIPRFREGSPRYALYQVVALSTSIALVVAALPGVSVGRTGAGEGAKAFTNVPEVAAIVPSPAVSEALENSLRAVEDGERESPRDHWDPAYVVEQVGRDPHHLFDWVAGNTFWVPYRGVLRGPVGVLMDRMGSSLDRAVLLGTLLEQAGHAVRLAHGELAADRAEGLLPSLVAARTAGLTPGFVPAAPDANEILAAAAQYRLDGPMIERSVAASAADGERLYSSLQARVADQTRRLRAAVAGPPASDDGRARVDAAVAALRDHWWVQRKEAGAWVDLDLLSPDMTALATAQETVALDGLAPSQRHQVIVRLVTERWSNGRVAERVALQRALTPAELVGTPVVLRLWPRRWPAQFPAAGSDLKGALRTTALAQKEWSATLQIGETVAERSSLLENGDINEHPAMSEVADVGSSGAAAADDAASLLRGMGTPQPESRASSAMLTAAWFEFEIHAPGGPARTIRRPVFDLLGPLARASAPVPPVQLDDTRRLLRSLSLTMETEILPVVCRISDAFVTHLLAQSLLRNRDVLRSLVRGEISDSSMRPDELFRRLAPMPGPLYTLARDRFDWNRFDNDIYIDSVDVLTRHLFFAPAGAKIHLRDATDIVTNDVGVDLSVADPFAARLEQGVLDTNAEAQLHRETANVASPANAFAASSDWVTLTSVNDPQISTLPFSADDRQRLTQDLAAGSVVIAPKTAVRLGPDEFAGWWRVDPVSGHALGVAGNGWGQAMAEYALVLEGAFVGFYLAYIECRANAGPGVQGSPTDVAGGWSPHGRWRDLLNRDFLVAPLSAAVSPCLGIAFSAAALSALLGKLAGSSRGGGGSSSGGRGSNRASGGPGGGGSAGGSASGGSTGGSSGGSGGQGSGAGGAGGGRPTGGGAPPVNRGGPPLDAPPPGRGPYQSDPYGKQIVNQNPNSVASKAMNRNGGVLDGADQAAQKAYKAGKQMGMTDDGAHDLSKQTYDNYVERYTRQPKVDAPAGQGDVNPIGDTANAGGRAGTLPLKSQAPCGSVPCGQSPQAKSVGGFTSLGNVLKGGS